MGEFDSWLSIAIPDRAISDRAIPNRELLFFVRRDLWAQYSRIDGRKKPWRGPGPDSRGFCNVHFGPVGPAGQALCLPRSFETATGATTRGAPPVWGKMEFNSSAACFLIHPG